MKPSIFDNDGPDNLVDADLYKAGIFLGCVFGLPAMYIWAIGIFAAGQSSTMTGTYAGQFVMEGFLNIQWSRWKRVLLTRIIAIAPTLSIALSYNDITDLTGMNDMLNALMSLMLPFALLPLMIFSSSRKVMGEFTNRFHTIAAVSVVSVLVVTINLYFVSNFVKVHLPKTWWIIFLTVIFFCYYMTLLAYLVSSPCFTMLCLIFASGWMFRCGARI